MGMGPNQKRNQSSGTHALKPVELWVLWWVKPIGPVSFRVARTSFVSSFPSWSAQFLPKLDACEFSSGMPAALLITMQRCQPILPCWRSLFK